MFAVKSEGKNATALCLPEHNTSFAFGGSKGMPRPRVRPSPPATARAQPALCSFVARDWPGRDGERARAKTSTLMGHREGPALAFKLPLAGRSAIGCVLSATQCAAEETMIRAAVLLAGMLAAAECGLEPPPYIKPCPRNDPNLDECALKSGIAAIPSILLGDRKYKVPTFNPMKITEIRIEDGNQGNAPTGLDIVLRDLEVYGLDRLQLKKVHFDLQKKHIEITGSTPELRMTSQYEMNGKILVVPIKGKGDGSVNMTDVDITHSLDYDLVTKEDGLEHMVPVNSSLVHKTKRMQIYLDNLFNGDKALSDNTNRFLNENWEAINAEFGPAIAQAIGEVGRQAIANCMELVAYKDLFPE